MKIVMNDVENYELFFGVNSEVGFLVLIQESNGTFQYKGISEMALSISEKYETGVSTPMLNALKLYEDDNLALLSEINAYREAGIDARLLSVYRKDGNTVLNRDETEEYVAVNLIVKLEYLNR